MPVSEREYQCIALEDPKTRWELHRGALREKPAMTFARNDLMSYLNYLLQHQLDRSQYRVHFNSRVRRSAENYYIPDLAVISIELTAPFFDREDILEAYRDPLPLVVEVWSPSTGAYDVDAKLPEYQRRGDKEIWRLHPFERSLTAWQRQPDGTYEEQIYRGGKVRPVALPGVEIDLDLLFAG